MRMIDPLSGQGQIDYCGLGSATLTEAEILSPPVSAMLRLQGAMRDVLKSAASPVPELGEALETVLTQVGDPGRRRVSGAFKKDRWRLGSAEGLHEIFVAERHLGDDVEDVADTLVHELAHLLASVRGLHDTSNRGRYHNASFKLCAQDLGLFVGYQKPHGYYTKGLSPELSWRLAHELRELEDALELRLNTTRTTKGGTGGVDEGAVVEETGTKRKFVFAVCGCQQPIRVAVGRWATESIFCAVCENWFVDPEESLTTTGQHHVPPPLGVDSPVIMTAMGGPPLLLALS